MSYVPDGLLTYAYTVCQNHVALMQFFLCMVSFFSSFFSHIRGYSIYCCFLNSTFHYITILRITELYFLGIAGGPLLSTIALSQTLYK